MVFLHISHTHPLIFNEVPKEKYEMVCNVCREQIRGPNYNCERCPWFVLHKPCAEPPTKLHHPLHLIHPLHPLSRPDWFFSLRMPEVKCDGCNRIGQWSSMYRCSDCNFKIDSGCVSLPFILEPEGHAHSLILMRRSVSFNCDACGREGKGMFYSCALCPFLVHIQCAPLPLIVNNIRHNHPLELTSPRQANQSDHPTCTICVDKVNIGYMVYRCSNCDFVTHLDCATRNELQRDETFKHSNPELDNSFTYVVKKSKLGEGNIEIAVEIKHFSHEHDLYLIDEQLGNKEKCDACILPIYHPFYSCTQCKFFLHKSCVELPKNKLHPLHQHPLNLLLEPPDDGKMFWCDACSRRCNGFTYNCNKCKFNLDVQCSLTSDTFNHDGHEHQLILSSTPNEYRKCNSCGFKRRKYFRCPGCEFTLDFKCATLPHSTRYSHMKNHLHFVIKLKKNPMMNIIVIFVRKHEIQNIGSIIVQISVFPLM